VFGGGEDAPASNNNILDYVTTATTGNATDFGDLTQARRGTGPGSNSVRGVFMGGSSPSNVNTIDFITIASTGNATDFGDLTKVAAFPGAASNGHGGLVGG
jgi:hypothetical protein